MILSLLYTISEKNQKTAHTSYEDWCLQTSIPVKVMDEELIYEVCMDIEQEH